MRTSQARLEVILAALLFSTGGAAIKTDVFSVAQVSGLRSAIAAVVLIAWLRGRITWSPAVIGIGVAHAATLTLFVASTKLTTAATAIFLQSTAPLYVLLLAPWVLGEALVLRNVAALSLIGTGLFLCVSGQSVQTITAPDPSTGTILAVASGVTWGITLVALRYVQRAGSREALGLSAVVAGNVIAALVALPWAWPLPPALPAAWATVGFLGVFQVALAYVFLTSAMRALPAIDVSLLLLIEPVFNPVWAWLIRGEQPEARVLAGGLLIVVAAALQRVMDARAARSPMPVPTPQR